MGGGATELSGPDLEKGVDVADLAPGVPLLGHAAGEPVVLVRVGEDVRAVGATCTHYGGPLAEGLVDGDTLRCPWHHACFDLRTGDAIGAPALAGVACWDVTRKGDLVAVRTKRTAPQRTPKTSPSSVVIVGAGAAGAACVEVLRKEGYAGTITMLGAGEGPVDRPNLSKDYLAGTAPEEWLPLGDVAAHADVLATNPATAIDTANKTVTTKDGKTISYGALLYAPGAEPTRLGIDGAGAPHVFTLRSVTDSRAIIARAARAKQAVVIGASFIGLEVAASLVKRGLEVHVVAPDPAPLGKVLGEALGARIKALHESKGVRFHLGTTPKAITEAAVTLANGEIVPADLVVMGVGVKPRLALAEAAGLAVDRGVVVDEELRASAPGVWAAGDVARYPEPRLGERVRIEHWALAERHGQAAARSMLGAGRPFTDVPFFWSAHYDVQISYVGHAPTYDDVEVFGSLERDDAAVAYRRGGKVLAVATINRDRISLAVEAAMEKNDLGAVEEIVRS
jgi:NADPH-dependent 2,4-dienoyl-CoA reductase/sulfur reductase-like enzyme/nitrite reductase/ring-hydroxylating ferredoxin subunit